MSQSLSVWGFKRPWSYRQNLVCVCVCVCTQLYEEKNLRFPWFSTNPWSPQKVKGQRLLRAAMIGPLGLKPSGRFTHPQGCCSIKEGLWSLTFCLHLSPQGPGLLGCQPAFSKPCSIFSLSPGNLCSQTQKPALNQEVTLRYRNRQTLWKALGTINWTANRGTRFHFVLFHRFH